MNTQSANKQRAKWTKSVRHRLSGEQRRQQILQASEVQFAISGFRATTTVSLAKAAGVSEPVLYSHFSTKQNLFREVVQRNAQDRLKNLRGRFVSMPDLDPLKWVERIAESTVMACVEASGNASIMAWGLMEIPQFAAEIYRSEIGSTEELWIAEIGTHFADSPMRTSLAVQVVPYAVHACMAFGLWLATLHHKPATARDHARQYASGIVEVARAALDFRSKSPA